MDDVEDVDLRFSPLTSLFRPTFLFVSFWIRFSNSRISFIVIPAMNNNTS